MSYFSRGNFTASDFLTLTGLLTAGALLVTGLSLFSGGLKPTGNNLYDIGTPTSSWANVYASGTVFAGGVSSTGNINPTTNNLFNIGSATLSWKDVYASGTARLTMVQASTGTVAAPSYSFIGDTDTGLYSTSDQLRFAAAGAQIAIFDTGGIALVGATNLLGSANNTNDIGSATRSWKDVYASGTAVLNSISAVNTTSTNLAITSLRSDLVPGTNNLRDIGSATLGFKDIYASGTANIGTKVLVPYGTTAAPSIAFQGSSNTGITGTAGTVNISANGSNVYSANTGNTLITAGGIGFLYGATVFRPQVNNNSDLGAYGYAWKGLYASGTSYMATTTYYGRTTVLPAAGMTTSTSYCGSATQPCCEVKYQAGGTKWWCTMTGGGYSCSNSVSCE